MREHEAYKAVYCGLCGQLGRSFGPVACMTLSYDFAFLAMLHYAAGKTAPIIESGRGCHFVPTRKRPVCQPGEALAFSADTAIITLYHKLRDNIQDSRFLGRAACRAALPFAARAHKKATARRPDCEAAIAEAMSAQGELERCKTASIDAACQPTALAMQTVCGQLSEDPAKKRILERIGYLVGRYVYLCDALDDLAKDLKYGGYNPLIYRYGLEPDADKASLEAAYLQGRDAIYLTAGEAGKAFALLEPTFFGPVLENVFYQGLRARADEIFAGSRPELASKESGA
ncbi:MAG: DUF5685 family protein [Oscillospiraceae bacterium]|nr:DUF5685 family protein [Oscillospiraceae bacterium]